MIRTYEDSGTWRAVLDIDALPEEIRFHAQTENGAKAKAAAAMSTIMVECYQNMTQVQREIFLQDIGGYPVGDNAWYVHPSDKTPT